MTIKKIERRPYFRLLKKDIESLNESDFILLSTELDSHYYKIKVEDIVNRYERGIGAPGNKPSEHWNSSIAGVSATEGLPQWLIKKALEVIPIMKESKSWIFQGNPDEFDMDKYLMEVDDNITWRVKRYKAEICIGDVVYLWRASGKIEKTTPGIIARAIVCSAVFKGTEDVIALDYWKTEDRKNEEVDRVWLKVQEVNRDLGMIKKERMLEDIDLKELLIIKSPQGTTFPLKDIETTKINKLWANECTWENENDNLSKGNTKPRKKKVEREVIERSQWVVDQTISRANSKCEVSPCITPSFEKERGGNYVEVHHLVTLASGGPDTLDNTVCLCPNHHREIHYGKNKKAISEKLRAIRKIE